MLLLRLVRLKQRLGLGLGSCWFAVLCVLEVFSLFRNLSLNEKKKSQNLSLKKKIFWEVNKFELYILVVPGFHMTRR